MDYSSIKTAFLAIVGYSQNENPSGYQVDATLIKDEDVLEEHELLTHSNLESIAPDFKTRYSAHDNTKADYAIDTIVYDTNENYYKALVNNPGLVLTIVSDWTPYSPYSEWLKTFLNQGIKKTVQEWQNLNTLERTTRDLLKSRNTLFPIQLSDTKVVDEGKQVGIEILPAQHDSIDMKIYEVGLQFDTAQTITLKLYDLDNLYSGDAVASYDFVYTTPNAIQWFAQEITINPNQNYWLTYDQDDITGQAINGLSPDGGSGRVTGYPLDNYVKFSGFSNTSTDWTNNVYNYDTNYGINLKFDVRKDITSLIVDHKELFTNAILKRTAVSLLRYMALNVDARNNRFQNNIQWNKQDILFEIEGDSESERGQGLSHDYKQALAKIQIDLSKSDPVAVPDKRSRIKHKIIG